MIVKPRRNDSKRVRESVKRRGSGEWIGWTKDMSIEYFKKVICPKFWRTMVGVENLRTRYR